METTGHRYWFDATIKEGATERLITVPGDDPHQAALWAMSDVDGSSRCSLERSDRGTLWYLMSETGFTRARIRLSHRRRQEA